MATYQSPGVYIEEISAGPRPVQSSGTSSTGFVGVLELPGMFGKGLGALTDANLKAEYANVLRPVGIDGVQASWNVARHFFPLGWKALARQKDAVDDAAIDKKIAKAEADLAAATDDKKKKQHEKDIAALMKERDAQSAVATSTALEDYVQGILGTSYSVDAPATPDALVALKGTNPYTLEADRTLVNFVEGSSASAWHVSMAVSLDPRPLIDVLASRASRLGEGFGGAIPGVDKADPSLSVDFEALQLALAEPAALVTGMDSFRIWRQEYARKLFIQLILTRKDAATDNTSLPTRLDQANDVWRALPETVRDAWNDWVRGQRGMRLLELSITGFFANGGSAAYLGMAVTREGVDLSNKSLPLKTWFDTVGDVALMCAPGLNREWQEAVLTFSRMPPPSGRGDIFAVLDTPRYLLTQPPQGVSISAKDRTADDTGAYAVPEVEVLGAPEVPSLRHAPNDTQMDQCEIGRAHV